MIDYNKYIHSSCTETSVKMIPWPDPVPYTEPKVRTEATQLPTIESVKSMSDTQLADTISDILIVHLKHRGKLA